MLQDTYSNKKAPTILKQSITKGNTRKENCIKMIGQLITENIFAIFMH